MKRSILFLFLIAMPFILFSNYATLDTSFNGTGFATLPLPTGWTNLEQTATVMQPDGKIIVAGNATTTVPSTSQATTTQVVLVRFNTDGTLDENFNANGTPAFTGSYQIAATPGYLSYTVPGNYLSSGYTSNQSTYGVALQTDGSIIVTGTISFGGYPYLFVAKFNSDGTLDTTFGVGTGITFNNGTNVDAPAYSNPTPVFSVGGSIVYPFYNTTVSYTIAQQVDTKILIAGQTANQSPVCIRFLPNGALDTTANGGTGFGTGNPAPGYQEIPSPEAQGRFGSLIKDIAQDAELNIYLAGQFNPSDDYQTLLYYPAIYQLSSAGILNTSYGTQIPSGNPITNAAVISTDINFIQGRFNQIIIQPDQKVTAIGRASFNGGTNYYMIIARFLSNGQLDTTFGNGLGYVINYTSSQGNGIHLNTKNKFIVCGIDETSSYTTLYRYNYDGSLDTTFTPSGDLIINTIGYTNIALGDNETSDGKIHLGATINSTFGALQILNSNTATVTTPEIAVYGFNSTYLESFLYINTYASIITDPTAQADVIEAINTILTTYTTDYALQSDFNFISYLYLIKPDLVAANGAMNTAYPASTFQINQCFQYLLDRINLLAAVQQ